MASKKPNKTGSVHVRFPEKIKVLIEEEAKRNYRHTQDEVISLVAEALHMRKYSIDKYL